MVRDGAPGVRDGASGVRVGVAGFGLAGRVFHAPLISSVEGLELAAVVERSSSTAKERYPESTIYRSVDELLQDSSIGLVVVATPNQTHCDLTRRALEAGKNVVVDKPVATSPAETAGLIDMARRRGLALIPFQNRRWDGDFQTVRQLIGERALGRLVHLQSTMDRWRPGALRRAWKDDPGEGGLLLDLGTHLVDQALVLFGRPDSVQAEVGRERDGEGASDSFTLRLRYSGGPSVEVAANMLSTPPRPRFHLRGTRGNFWKWGVDPQEEALSRITRIDQARWGEEPSAQWGTLSVDEDHSVITRPVETAAGDYRLFYEGVRDALLGKGSPPVAAVAAWRTARVLEDALESSRVRCEIECDWSWEPKEWREDGPG